MNDRAIGTLALNWTTLVRDVAFSIAGQFIRSGAPKNEHMDEFLIRQAMREGLIQHLSRSIVTMKEVPYSVDHGQQQSSRRLDLTVGFPGNTRDIAIEIKSTRPDLPEIQADWEKLSEEKANIRLSLVGGVTSDEGKIKKLDAESLYEIQSTASKARLLQRAIKVPLETESGASKSIAFAMLWAIGKTHKELNPNIGYSIYVNE
jgi:hypothetical protein